MTTRWTKRIKIIGFSLAISATLASCHSNDAIDPCSITEQRLELDMDGDDIVDARLVRRALAPAVVDPDGRSVSYQYILEPAHHNTCILDRVTEAPFEKHAQIDALLAWDTSSCAAWLAYRAATTANCVWEGRWVDAQDQYLAVRISSVGKHRYGWIEITAAAAMGKITLQDWFLHPNPDHVAFAGEK